MPRGKSLKSLTPEELVEHRRQVNREKSRRWRAANPEKNRENVAVWEAANPEKVKEYRVKASKTYTETHREDRRRQWREWNARNKTYRQEYARLRSYEKNYGITVEEYDALVHLQGGRCAICRIAQPGGAGRWHVDHCHSGGHVRGLLCTKCNTALGLFKDDPVRLGEAIKYLQPPT